MVKNLIKTKLKNNIGKASILFILVLCSVLGTIWFKPLEAVIKDSSSTSMMADGQFILKPESKLWLEGNSTLHPYTSTATILNGYIEFEEIKQAKENQIQKIIREKTIKKFDLAIPVIGLKSGKPRLDKNMYEALKFEKYPEIHFKMLDYEIQIKDQNLFWIKVKGILTVAGEEKETLLEAQAFSVQNAMKIVGTKDLLMTDFDIVPPQLMLGAIKTDNKVRISYEIYIALNQ